MFLFVQRHKRANAPSVTVAPHLQSCPQSQLEDSPNQPRFDLSASWAALMCFVESWNTADCPTHRSAAAAQKEAQRFHWSMISAITHSSFYLPKYFNFWEENSMCLCLIFYFFSIQAKKTPKYCLGLYGVASYWDFVLLLLYLFLMSNSPWSDNVQI